MSSSQPKTETSQRPPTSTPSTDSNQPPSAVAVAVGSVHPPANVAPPPRVYRGGFRSSICCFFSDPSRRTDCCALSYCGVLSSDRNRYLLTGEHPPPWWLRACKNLLVPLCLLGAINYCNSKLPKPDPSIAAKGQKQTLTEEEETYAEIRSVLVLVFWLSVIFLSILGWLNRLKTRRIILGKLYEIQHPEGDAVGLETHRLRHQQDSRCAHAVCGCYARDDFQDYYGMSGEAVAEESNKADMCTVLWNILSTLCCGCCGAWCQCCGMCATGQEEREVNALIQPNEKAIDYVTFEPYKDYFPSIQALRETMNGHFLAHCRALSHLSIKLLRGVGSIMLLLFLFSLTDIDSNFTLANMLVLLATFFQAFLILHFVHWRWHRFDLSFDAVVKYFSCGFIFSTGIAVVYEMLVSTVLGIIMYIFVLPGLAVDMSKAGEEPDPFEVMKHYMKDHVGLFSFFIFLDAFVVAALVEELCKYFGYWMVEHPDFMSEEEMGLLDSPSDAAVQPNETEATTDASEGDINDEGTGVVGVTQRRSLNSTGVGITIAMVSVSLGFACCENLMYVFVYTPPNVATEIWTLLLRSLFPVHPLAAAIQSIGVCRRDLEGERAFKLGRILFPAVLLHGSFDFILMLLAFLDAVSHMDDEENDEDNESTDENFDESIKSQLPALASGMAIVVIGLVYYILQSRAQKKRLAAMDFEQQSSMGDNAALIV